MQSGATDDLRAQSFRDNNRNHTLLPTDADGADKSFTVPILDDDLLEGAETIGLTLSNPTGNGALSRSRVHDGPSEEVRGQGIETARKRITPLVSEYSTNRTLCRSICWWWLRFMG